MPLYWLIYGSYRLLVMGSYVRLKRSIATILFCVVCCSWWAIAWKNTCPRDAFLTSFIHRKPRWQKYDTINSLNKFLTFFIQFTGFVWVNGRYLQSSIFPSCHVMREFPWFSRQFLAYTNTNHSSTDGFLISQTELCCFTTALNNKFTCIANFQILSKGRFIAKERFIFSHTNHLKVHKWTTIR